MQKVIELDIFLRQYEQRIGFTQFTIDYIEVLQDDIQSYLAGSDLSESDFLHAAYYRADNVVEIMRPDLKDYAFFLDLRTVLGRMTGAVDSATRRVRMIEKAGLN